ncbi:MAG: RraA family protein [Betaproteobacteria bacterium]|jgi:RraA family protein|nr:RraA family protein [Betaproteobacteria bacterium]
MALGFRVFPSPARPPAKLIEALRPLPTSNISDNMARHHGAGAALRPWHRGAKMIGAAFTVKTRSGDNLMAHKAIDMAAPGDVIIVDAGGAMDHAVIGEIMTSIAARRGIAGIVIDGAIRDSDAIAAGDFPVYARGVTHRGPYKDGPGEINVTVSVAGMVVNPGDLIVGDADGVLAIPLSEAEAIIALATAQKAREDRTLAEIAAGTLDRSWVDKMLRDKGCTLP